MTETRPSPMNQHWEAFAKNDPMHYIATQHGHWDRDAFFESGREIVDAIMLWIGDSISRNAMLEIGCGLGRTAVHWARHFQCVTAIDISPTMIEQARQMNLPSNITFDVCNGADLGNCGEAQFDMVYSAIVFQHIADIHVIDSYMREISRVLRPGGKAAIQFDTRCDHVLHRLYKSLPDVLLPKHHRRFIRRYRRDAQSLRSMFQSSELHIVDERAANSPDHFFLLERAR